MGLPTNSYDNQMNRFSPKVSLGQDINTVFSSGTNNQSAQFQAFNNKLKQKKQHHQMMTQNSQNSQQMLNSRTGGGISNFMQSYNQNMVNQHGAGQFVQTSQATQSINSVTNNNQYEYSIPGDAIYSTSNLSQFKN